MPHMKVNLSDVESFEAMPADDYAVEVEKVEVRENKQGDALYLNWELVVLDGDYENRRLWYITSLKETALFRLKETFIELGVLDDDEEELEIEYDDDPAPTPQSGPIVLDPELEGIECTARVSVEMYDARERNRVDQLLANSPKKTKRTTKASRKAVDTSRSSRRITDEAEDDDEDEEEEAPRRRSAPRSNNSSSRRRRRIR